MQVSDTVRRALRQQMAAVIPAQHIDEIVDIACHAAERAINEMIRVALHTSPDSRIGMAAIGPAFGLLVSFAEDGMAGLKDFAAKEPGLKAYHAEIKVAKS